MYKKVAPDMRITQTTLVLHHPAEALIRACIIIDIIHTQIHALKDMKEAAVLNLTIINRCKEILWSCAIIVMGMTLALVQSTIII